MAYETDDNSRLRHPVRRGKYKVHTGKSAQQKKSTKQNQKKFDAEDELIDEASEESFPASDPPSWSPTTTGGPDKDRHS
ncbi:hypothetical protein [Saccharophagus sp. K07]|uniref:hypothetical protein n=1 Tax=Saccharophagus sp. K07 TaxID=2283636 RepID=UPI001CA31BB5|nr:hypothetical protein [Saccharophagus sp. K07]